ncbi:MAG: hypothetical protein MI862_08015 [Desulfobacterales bacterium]|nr:hypothetical protein [Desulfobacterales bacterium]
MDRSAVYIHTCGPDRGVVRPLQQPVEHPARCKYPDYLIHFFTPGILLEKYNL